jgi:hypothetical protein
MSIQELKAEVARLPAADMKAFARWFGDFCAGAWDRQSEADILAGKVDKSAPKADHQFRPHQKRPLQLKSFPLGMTTPMPTKSELANEMFDQK